MLERIDIAGDAPPPLTPPRRYLVRMAVFLVLVGFIAFILYRTLWAAFMANPALNSLILAVTLIGVIIAVRQVWRLFPEVRWVNDLQNETLLPPDAPRLLAPIAGLIASRANRASLSVGTTRSLLDAIAARLDESRELLRYLAGLLVFLGLLGTFWGLIETVGSVGRVIQGLSLGGDAGSMLDALKEGLAAPLSGMGISFSSSLFGLAGSLILGFLDLQSSQAQNRFYIDLEDWLSTSVHDLGTEPGTAGGGEVRGAIEKLRDAMADAGSGKAATAAMANLAEAIQGLVHHMRTEQQMIRDWVDSQAEQHRDIRRLLEMLVRENAHK